MCKPYTDAIVQVDRNVYFIESYSLLGKYGHDACTVDSPTNYLEVWRVVEVIGDVMKLLLK